MRNDSRASDELKRQPIDALPADRLERAMTLLRQIRASGQKVVVAFEGDRQRFETVVDLFMAGVLLSGARVTSDAGYSVIVLPVAAMATRAEA